MFPSLVRLAQESLKRDPHAGDLYVFRGRRGGLIKIIWHDGHGACLLRHLSSLRRLRARLFKKRKFSRKNQKISFPPRSNPAILSLIKAEMAGEAKVAFDIFSNLRWREQMSLPRLWTRSQELTPDAFRAMRREMANAFRAFDQNSSSPDIGAGAPAISVAETNDALEVTAELPGVDEKDIKVSLDDNQLIISGEKKAESTKDEKYWHVEERSYGSFYRWMFLPFEPEDGAVDAHFDKGVLHLTIKKPAKAIKTTKTINVKTGAAPSKAA
jgi:HSP20 family protein